MKHICSAKLCALFFIVSACVLLCGCNGTSVVWSAASKAPNGIFTAKAQTVTTGGFGTAAGPVTYVYLTFPEGSWPSTMILSFANPTANPIGVTAVKMKWLDNSHLDVTYSKPAVLSFQAVRALGVEITVHQASQ